PGNTACCLRPGRPGHGRLPGCRLPPLMPQARRRPASPWPCKACGKPARAGLPRAVLLAVQVMPETVVVRDDVRNHMLAAVAVDVVAAPTLAQEDFRPRIPAPLVAAVTLVRQRERRNRVAEPAHRVDKFRDAVAVRDLELHAVFQGFRLGLQLALG